MNFFKQNIGLSKHLIMSWNKVEVLVERSDPEV
jgi:hypothetical protein